MSRNVVKNTIILFHSILFIHQFVTIIMNHEFHLLDWSLLPFFMKEAVEDFPFEDTIEAQMYSDLLVSRMRCRLINAPDMDESQPIIIAYLDTLEAELVYSPYHGQLVLTTYVASRGKVRGQMLLCQLQDQTSQIL